MIFGSSQDTSSPEAPALDTAQVIFDVTMQDFETRVMAVSMQIPVIVDFWAPWCGPCKQLMPTLEKVIAAAGGKVLLAKVNIDQNQELAKALRVQSVPTVYGFFQGQPIDAFTGVQPESKIKEFVQKLITAANGAQPDALNIPDVLKEAAELLAQANPQNAHELYSSILHQDALNAEAYVGTVRCFIEIGQVEQAVALVEQAPEEIATASIFAQARTAVDLAQNTGNATASVEELEAKINSDGNDHQARIDLAHLFYAQGKKEEALQTLLDSIELDMEWEDQAARKELLKLMEAMGLSDPVAQVARRKLSTLLFS